MLPCRAIPHPQDSVRLLSVESGVGLARVLRPDETQAMVAPVLEALGRDSAWRVRYMVASHMPGVGRVLGSTLSAGVAATFAALLTDAENEVRTAAASKVTEMAVLLGADLTLTVLLPPVRELVADTCPFTRAALASEVLGLAAVLPKEEVFAQLLPLFLHLLKDEHAEVRLNIISKLGTRVLLVSLPCLRVLGVFFKKKWRVLRSAVCLSVFSSCPDCCCCWLL